MKIQRGSLRHEKDPTAHAQVYQQTSTADEVHQEVLATSPDACDLSTVQTLECSNANESA
jgi:hypothetical protein